MTKAFEKADEIYFRLGIIYKQQQKYQESLDVCSSPLRSGAFECEADRRPTREWGYSAFKEFCAVRPIHWRRLISGSRSGMFMSR